MAILKEVRSAEGNLDGYEGNSFSVDVNSKTFKILFEQLYSDKITAVIRELSTNAYDSHVEAGKPEAPFEIKLPTGLDPKFWVRDFGTSLSHEDVLGLYATVFRSTKEKTNTAVGQLGLGSKSPFAYTDSFTVTTWRDGKKRVYDASMNAGIPEIRLIGTWDSDEETGLKVSFPVKPQDFAAFERKARLVSLGFEVKPNGISDSGLPMVLAEYGNWKIYDNGSDHFSSMFNIRQGCVVYPVSDSYISQYIHYRIALVYTVPIGSVEVTPSREALHMDEDTVAYLDLVRQTFKTEVKEYLRGEISACKNRLQATKRTFEFQQIFKFAIVNSFITELFGERVITNYISIRDNNPGLRIERGDHSVYVNNLETFRLVVVRSDQKVIRLKSRIKEFARRGGDFAVVVDPTSKQLERIVRRLGLRGDQVISACKLADPGPPARTVAPKSADGEKTVQGVYEVRNTNDRLKHVLIEAVTVPRTSRFDLSSFSEGYVWLQVDRITTRQAKLSGAMLYNLTQDNLPYLMDLAIDLGVLKINSGTKIFLMTRSASKRYSPEPIRRLDTLVYKAFNAVWAASTDALTYFYTRRHLGAQLILRSEEILEKIYPANSAFLSAASRATTLNGSVGARFFRLAKNVDTMVDSQVVAELQSKYPLLFGNGTVTDLYLRYIEEQNQKNNNRDHQEKEDQ